MCGSSRSPAAWATPTDSSSSAPTRQERSQIGRSDARRLATAPATPATTVMPANRIATSPNPPTRRPNAAERTPTARPVRAATAPVRRRLATRAAPAVSTIAMRPDNAPRSGSGNSRRTASSANWATTAPATTGATGTLDVAGTMLMSPIVTGSRTGQIRDSPEPTPSRPARPAPRQATPGFAPAEHGDRRACLGCSDGTPGARATGLPTQHVEVDFLAPDECLPRRLDQVVTGQGPG